MEVPATGAFCILLVTVMGNGFPHSLDQTLSPLLPLGVRGPPTPASCRKTLVPTRLSHSLGGTSSGSVVGSKGLGSMFKFISSCPHLDVLIGGVNVSCLLDTESMVSTVVESFFLQYFKPWGQDR